eukprot:3819616-Prymnesium_polylepis.2
MVVHVSACTCRRATVRVAGSTVSVAWQDGTRAARLHSAQEIGHSRMHLRRRWKCQRPASVRSQPCAAVQHRFISIFSLVTHNRLLPWWDAIASIPA